MNLEAFLFAQGIEKKLRRASLTDEGAGYYRVVGDLVAVMVVAPVEIWVWQNGLLRQDPPRAFCREPWMRDEVDWHNSASSGMCWVLDDQWRDEMDHEELAPAEFLARGQMWLLKGMESLIDRHYVGHYKKMRRWPKHWEAYGHFGKGPKQFEREKRTETGYRDQ